MALLAFVQRKSPLPESAKPEEVEALRYVRREAIRALGQTRYPAVLNAKTKQIEGQTAWWLLKVTRKDGLSPSPSFSEQVEAAAAICQLRPELLDRYHVDYAAYHIGQFVKEFANHYTAHESDPIPWKFYSVRFAQALNEMKSMASALTGRRQAEGKYAADVADQSSKLVSPLQVKKAVVDANALTALSTWLQAKDKGQKKSATLYEGVPESVIKEAEAAGTGGE